MLYIAFVVFWAVILTPLAIGYLRDRGPEKSIQHFHEEHARFAEREHSAEPVNRLADGYARPVGRGTVFADDNYDNGYHYNEVQHFAETGPGRQHTSRRTSRQRRSFVMLTLFTFSVGLWIIAVFVGGYTLYAWMAMAILDTSYIGLYFIATNFGWISKSRANDFEMTKWRAVDIAEYRLSYLHGIESQDQSRWQDFENYPHDAVG